MRPVEATIIADDHAAVVPTIPALVSVPAMVTKAIRRGSTGSCGESDESEEDDSTHDGEAIKHPTCHAPLLSDLNYIHNALRVLRSWGCKNRSAGLQLWQTPRTYLGREMQVL